MVVTVEISSNAENRLRRLAEKKGKSFESFAGSLLERSGVSLDEAAKPLREGFKESGMSEDEIDSFLDEVLEEVRAERRLGRQ
jgi:hypothetical protein